MRRWGWIAVIVGVNLYLWLLVIAAGFYPNDCHLPNCAGRQLSCFDDRLLFPLRVVARLLDRHEGIAVFLATAALALITYWLADVTRRLVVGSEDSSRRHLRAYVSFQGLPQYWEEEKISGRVVYNWRVRPLIVNTGGTPTRNLRVFVDSVVTDEPIPESEDLTDRPIPTDHMRFGRGQLGPKMSMQAGTAPHGGIAALSHETIDEIIKNKKFLYVWGYAAYNVFFRVLRSI